MRDLISMSMRKGYARAVGAGPRACPLCLSTLRKGRHGSLPPYRAASRRAFAALAFQVHEQQ